MTQHRLSRFTCWTVRRKCIVRPVYRAGRAKHMTKAHLTLVTPSIVNRTVTSVSAQRACSIIATGDRHGKRLDRTQQKERPPAFGRLFRFCVRKLGFGTLPYRVFNMLVENSVQNRLSTWVSDSSRDASTDCTELSAHRFPPDL